MMGAQLQHLHRLVGLSNISNTAFASARFVAVSAGASAIAYVAWRILDGLLGRSLPAQAASVTLAAGGALVSYGACQLALHDPDALKLARMLRRQLTA